MQAHGQTDAMRAVMGEFGPLMAATPQMGSAVPIAVIGFDIQIDYVVEVIIPKPTDDEKQRFRDVVPSDHRVTVKPMFANLGAQVNGVMFAGTFGSDTGVKLNETDRDGLKAVGGGPFGPPERPMGGYTTIPALDDDSSATWLERAMNHVAQLPPKKPKAS